MAGVTAKKPGVRVVPAGMAADILAGLEAPAPRVAATGPRASSDLPLVRRILGARDPSALAELDAGLAEAAKGPAELAVFLARPIPRREARDPLDTATDALAAAAAFVESLPPNDRRAATMLNAASTLAKTVETIASRRPREPTKDEVEERIAARRDDAIKKISEYTGDARAKLEADRGDLVAWARSNLGPMIASELERRLGLMLGDGAE